jgi:hypothetical protein
MSETTMNVTESIEDLTLEDQLSEISADLVEFKSNQIFLKRLFSHHQGEWLKVVNLISDMETIIKQINLLPEKISSNLQVTWLDYSHSVYGEGYCLITFFEDQLHWSNVALFNKQYLSNQNYLD